MKIINLRDYYPFYSKDMWTEVPDHVAIILLEAKRAEAAYRLRVYRNKAYYSLDVGDGMESDVLVAVLPPSELYEQKLTKASLYAALASLPVKQRQRVHAHYYLCMSKAAIAQAEGVNESTVRRSIARALQTMQKNLKHFR